MGVGLMLDASQPGFAENPWPAYAALRERGLVWDEGLGMWLAARFADVQSIAVSRDMHRSALAFADEATRARLQREGNFHDMPYHERFVQTSMLELDGPAHDRLRLAVFPFFTRTRLAHLRDWVRAHADAVLAPLLAAGRFDFTNDFAAVIPGQVIGRLVGTDPDEAAIMTRWSEEVVSYFDPVRTAEGKARAEEATRAFHDRLVDLRAARLAAPQDDLMSALTAAEAAGKLQGDELISTAMQLLHAGHGSTVDAMGGGMQALLDHPDQIERLRGDPALMPLAVQEMFRHAAPLPFFHRYAATDVTVAGQSFPTGTKFGLLYAAANRDPESFYQPDHFDAGRQPNRHVAFGAGPHICLGNNLGRLVMEEAFAALLAATRQIAPDGAAEWKPGLQAHGPLRLPIRVTPA